MRIGNFVKVRGELCKVVGIMEGHIIAKGADQVLAKEWEPVKITQKIFDQLEPNNSQAFTFQFEGKVKVCYMLDLIMEIEDLHEYQNVHFYLTRTDLKRRATHQKK